MFKKLIIAATTLMLFTACDPFEGVLSVNQTLVVKSTESDKVKNITVPAGQYDSKFEFPSKDQIQIKLNIGGKKTKINIKTNGKINIPDNGDFIIAAATLGQDFHAAGKSATKVTQGPVQTGYERCSYQRREVRCTTDANGNTVCREYYVTVYGQQFVEYQDTQTDKKISVGFYKDSSGYLATFAGEKSYSERYVRYQGQCY